jgi:hypothetical protein
VPLAPKKRNLLAPEISIDHLMQIEKCDLIISFLPICWAGLCKFAVDGKGSSLWQF